MKENTLKILLIEDDEDDYILTCDVLSEVKGTNYNITWVSRFSEALEAICSNKYDICLVDYRLGEGTGIELISKAMKQGVRTPMILLTGQGDKEIDIEATNAGAADYLIKGKIESGLLERSIRYAVAHSKMLDNLRESEERFRSIIESASDAIVLANSLGQIILWNESAHTIFGYAQDEIIGQPLTNLFPNEYYTERNGIESLLSTGILPAGNKTSELKGLRKTGEEFPAEISLSSWDSMEGPFYAGIIRDITQRKELENQLTHQALHDPLTKLANRVLFRNRVEHALSRVSRHQEPVAVLFLDLDNFKTINDSLGHAAGDKLLISVAERLRACLRVSDTPARLGGDEFAILVENAINAEDANGVAERLFEILRAPFDIEGKEVFVGVSIGIATSVTGKEAPEELLRNADLAMYMAKNQGKGRHIVYENNMHAAVLKRMEIEADLRRALEREEFILHYQPIIDLNNSHFTGMEALLRWQHPQRGLIPPMEFIPIAEETGLIVPIGRWVLETACKQGRYWHQKYLNEQSFYINVNLSSRQFQQPQIIETIAQALEKSGLPPNCLVIEITESIVLQNTEATIAKLSKLKELGVRLAIDDFGTGYSSLSYLQKFPVDILKIDKSFVDKIGNGLEGAAVARAIITMSDTLQLMTVAEGIEKAEQRHVLQDLGCQLGQGYHFAKPLSAENMEEFLNNESMNHDFSHLSNLTVDNNWSTLVV